MPEDSLNLLLPEVRQRIEACLPPSWPELNELVREHLTGHPLPSPVILPLASCAAVGGRPEQAIPTAAAWALMLLSIRWFDDAQDQDRPDGLWARLGISRATNLAAATLSLSWKVLTSCSADEMPRSILHQFADAALDLAAGQDLDLRGNSLSVDQYWHLMRQKCGAYFALAGRAGAMHGTSDPKLICACERYGEHVGIAIQILDDLEGVFFPRGAGDLAFNKATLPVLYGMAFEHEGRDDLRVMFETESLGRNAERVRRLLDRINTREFLLWAAIAEREQAIEELGICPNPNGARLLEIFVNSLFIRLEDALPGRNDIDEALSASTFATQF